MPTTPTQINDPVRAFASVLVPNAEPVTVHVETDTDSTALDCFGNVERRIERAGGGRRYGWAIWTHGNVMIEGEFHAVWIAPDGRLVDVTPHDIESEIVFVPDKRIQWETDAPRNRRRALRPGAAIDRAMKGLAEADAAREAYWASRREGIDYVRLPLHRANIRPNEQCRCGSGQTYEGCCRRLND